MVAAAGEDLPHLGVRAKGAAIHPTTMPQREHLLPCDSGPHLCSAIAGGGDDAGACKKRKRE